MADDFTDVAKVEERCEPLVVVAYETNVLLDTHDGSIREGSL